MYYLKIKNLSLNIERDIARTFRNETGMNSEKEFELNSGQEHDWETTLEQDLELALKVHS